MVDPPTSLISPIAQLATRNSSASQNICNLLVTSNHLPSSHCSVPIEQVLPATVNFHYPSTLFYTVLCANAVTSKSEELVKSSTAIITVTSTCINVSTLL